MDRENKIRQKMATALVQCAAPARQYAICVTTKGINVGHLDCQKQFTAFALCLAKQGAPGAHKLTK